MDKITREERFDEEPKYLTNRELGERLGVSDSMASRIRRGRRLPSVRTLRRCHKALGIPYESLAEAHEQGAEAFGHLLHRHTQRR